MKKKYTVVFVLILALFQLSIYAQNNADYEDDNSYISADVVLRQTAIRCAINAKNFLEDGNFSSALESSKKGLSYDDSVSDLWYTRALSEKALFVAKTSEQVTQRSQKYEICEFAKNAFELNDWVSFSSEQGKILYAQCLVDINEPEKACEILKNSFSSDVEYIRCQAYYAMKDFARARSIISTASKVFPEDERFPYLFFRTEFFASAFKDEKPDNATLEISQRFLKKIQKYQTKEPDILFYASFFADSKSNNGSLSEKDRLLRQYFSEKKIVPEAIYVGIKEGLLTQNQSYNYFIKFCALPMNVNIFEKTLSCFTDKEIISSLEKYLSSFSGILYSDFNENFYAELYVQYKSGRPFSVFADCDENSKDDFVVSCNFGFPIACTVYENNIEIEFDAYPNIKKTIIDSDVSFSFIDGEVSWQPLELTEKEVYDKFSFYFVTLSHKEMPNFSPSEYLSLLQKSYEVVAVGYDDGRKEKIFTIRDEVPVEIVYRRNGLIYAKAFFVDGILTERWLDMDFNEEYEACEFYKYDEKNYRMYLDDFVSDGLYFELFGTIKAKKGLYIYKMGYDYDADGLFDCVDEFLTDGSKITWYEGYNETSSYEKHLKNGVKYETFTLNYENEKIAIDAIDEKPIRIRDNLEEKNISYDEENGVYFIGELPPSEICSSVAEKIKEFPGNNFFRALIQYQNVNIMILRLGGRVFAQCFD